MSSSSARYSFLLLSVFLSSFFLLGPGLLEAQTSVTSNDGGTAVSGSLYEAVTFLNEITSNASITLDMTGSTSVILNQALPSINPNMTFYGTLGTDMGISVIGESESEASLRFNQNLGMDAGVTFSLSNDGTGGMGQLDSSIVGAGLSMGGNSVLQETGGPIVNGALGITGDASAGNASMNLGSFTLSTNGNSVNLTGGGLTSSTGGISSNATGGSAWVSLGALTVSGTGDSFALTGGALADSGSSTIGGNGTGGAVSWNSGNLNLNGTGDSLTLSGGGLTVSTGGAIQGEANGGSAEVGGGSITLAGSGNNLSLTGGELNCGNGGVLLANGSGGSASVNIGGLTLSGNGDGVNVTGGLLDTGSSGAVTGNGSGGAASIFADNLALLGSNNGVTITGGEFNNLNGTDQGNVLGGSASVSVSTLSLSGTGDNLAIAGGELTNTTGGAGGTAAGGGAYLTAASVSLSAGTTVSVVGGSVVGTGTEGTAAVSIGTLSGAGVVTMGGNGASLQISSGSFSGIIEGNESLQMLTSGFLTLSGANSYTGGTTIALGTINVDTGGALGTGGIINSSNLNYVDNALAGSNTIQNNGTLSFSNNASANNASVTNLGNVYFNNNSNAGSATLINGASGLLAFRDGSSAQNATLLSLDDAPATIEFLNQSNAGSSTITNGTGDLLSFEDSSSAGSAMITNRGTMTFSGSSVNPPSTAGSANITTDAGATLLFQGFSTGGTAQLTTNSGGFTDFSGEGGAAVTVGSIAGSGTYNLGSSDVAVGANGLNTSVSGVIEDGGSGGSLTKIGADILILSGNNTYTGGTLISGGILSVDTGGTLGTGAVTNNSDLYYVHNATAGNANITNGSTGLLLFENSSTAGSATITDNGGQVSFSNLASGGTARLILSGEGYLNITGESSVPVTLGSIEGSGFVSLGGNNLTTGSNNLSTTFAGAIADGGFAGNFGSLTKIGTGTLTLSGDNSYMAGTNIDGGILVAANSEAFGGGSVAVDGGTLILSGLRTLNLGNNYTQTIIGTLQLGLNSSTPNQWDSLRVTGVATLSGQLVLAPFSGFTLHDNETFTLLTASSVTGTFSSVSDTESGSAISLIYQPGDVLLEAFANAPSFSALALTPNQKVIGGVLDSLATNSQDPALINALDAQPDSALPGIYDQISPASLTPIYRIGFSTAQAEAGIVGQRLSQLFGSSLGTGDLAWNGGSSQFAGNLPASAEAGMAGAQPQRWSGFADGLGNFASITSDGNGPGYQFSTGGLVAGLDYCFSKDWAGGLLLSYNQSSSSQTTGTVNVTGGEVGFFTGIQKGGWYLDALVESGINSYATQRGLLGQTATGNTQGQLYSGELNTGFDWKWQDFKWGPYLSGQYTRVNINTFNESGSLAPLSFGAQGESYLDSDLGVEASPKWNLNGLTLAPSVKAAWEHLYQGNLDSLDASMGGGGDFTVKGPALGTNAALLAVGLDAQFDRGFSAFVAFQGRLGQANYEERSLTGGVDLGF